MKEILKEEPKEKSVFSSSLTKSEASNPILINKQKTVVSKKRAVAQSCPTFTFVPPPAPSSKPLIPSRDPPPMLLPPSPPVFSPMQIQAAQSQLAEVKNVLSRSLTNFSSSCPDPSYLRPPFGLGGQLWDYKTPEEPVTPPQQISQELFAPPSEERMSELGKSPTIFSLLQGSSVPPSRMGSFRASAFNTSVRQSVNEYGPSFRQSVNEGQDTPEDDLLFSISLDQHDQDGSYLADSTRDYLHL